MRPPLDIWIETMKTQGFSSFTKEEHPDFTLVRWKNDDNSQFSMMYKFKEERIHSIEGLSEKWGEWEDLSETLQGNNLSDINAQELIAY